MALEGDLSLDDTGWSDTQKQSGLALLLAGATLIERIGGKRRRGTGRCAVSVIGPKQITDWATALENPGEPPSVEMKRTVPGKTRAGGDATTDSRSPSPEWVVYDVTVELMAPLAIPKRTIGNVVETLDYLPGTSLLPAILGAMRRASPTTDVDVALRRDKIIVGNATIQIDGAAGRPLPRSHMAPKGNTLAGSSEVRNRLKEAEAESNRQWKAQRIGFVGGIVTGDRGGDEFGFLDVPLGSRTHNTIDDSRQRPTSAVGGVYTYEYLRERLVLLSQVVVEAGVARELGEQWLSQLGPETLGRSRKDEYGRVHLAGTRRDDARAALLGSREGVKPGSDLFVWLLSDVLLLDERLRPTTSKAALVAALEAALRSGESAELGLTLRDDQSSGTLSWLGGTGRRESWHTRWQLPRPSLVGLAAGSVAVLNAKGAIPAARLMAVEACGIGERRAEGFGRLLFNDPFLTAMAPLIVDRASLPPLTASVQRRLLNDGASSTARHIERAAWRTEIARSAESLAARTDQRRKTIGVADHNTPSSSQLGTLRALVSRVATFPDRSIIKEWVEHVKGAERTGTRWPDEALDKFLAALLDNEAQVWTLIARDGVVSDLTLTITGEADLKRELWGEAFRAIVFACIRAEARFRQDRKQTTELATATAT